MTMNQPGHFEESDTNAAGPGFLKFTRDQPRETGRKTRRKTSTLVLKFNSFCLADPSLKNTNAFCEALSEDERRQLARAFAGNTPDAAYISSHLPAKLLNKLRTWLAPAKRRASAAVFGTKAVASDNYDLSRDESGS